MQAEQIRDLAGKIRQNVAKVIIGAEETVDLLLIAVLGGGHVLLEDVPGTGKTKLAMAMAASLGGSFKRIQFTPDILPSDITGMNIYNQKEGTFVFRQGGIFANVVLADEINRATPRSQSALLECMQERQVSVDGVTYPLAAPFLVLATQNPVEIQGTFPLPEAQLDRFMMRLSMGYPSVEESVAILQRFQQNDPLEQLAAVVQPEEMLQAIASLGSIQISVPVQQYIAQLCAATRTPSNVRLGVSTRGMLALMRAAQGKAALYGRDYVLPDDVQAVAPWVLPHRILCRYEDTGTDAAQLVVQQVLQEVPVPTEQERPA